MVQENILEVEQLSFLYEGSWLLRNLNFSLKRGEIATLIGPSGSGKTTLFKLLTGILRPDQGTITVAQQKLPEGYGQVAYMMQEDLLLPWRTVIQNMTLMNELGSSPRSNESVLQEALQLLHEMKMGHCANFFPNQLSGGMRQRISLARALLHRCPLLLLDEPFSSLDLALREQMYELLREIRTSHQTTILLVTHDFRDALALSDHIFLLSNHHICKDWHITDGIRRDPYASAALLAEMAQGIS